MRTIHYAELAPLHADCHVARSFYHPGYDYGVHDHDFAEAMWVEIGAVGHDSGGTGRQLAAGEIVLVRPRHRHGIRGVANMVGVVVNVAFPAEALTALERRYGARELWGDGPEPRTLRLGGEALAALSRRAEALRLGQDDVLARDSFLVDLLDRLRPRHGVLWSEAPAWLADALMRLTEPPLLSEGLPALVRLTHRSREYISRSIRTTCRMTATCLLTELRLRWAEQQLALSDLPIAEIARGCGIGRAHLHHLFDERYGRNPRDYRIACRGAAGL
jgi:AraC-like DNA-binding protein/mannose-6-phosphate isomerase-like protein (cupin superfamily)